ncbi:MAG: hypothetical protein JWN93_3889 [Hyphomicrobiales bacterium]|nr:hypothetical protein [Hyphomicrobiales bacterium]
MPAPLRLKSEFALYVLASVAGAGLLGFAISLFLPVAGSRDIDGREIPAGWSETAWPFTRDQFPPGVAYECRAPFCGTRIRIAVRPKLGFCDCTAGVADDAMLDQIGDVELIGTGFAPVEVGREIAVGAMKGRARRYGAGAPSAGALSVAFSRKCDVMVATALIDDAPESAARAMAFVQSAAVVNWAGRVLGR